jgi:hypothetical protein
MHHGTYVPCGRVNDCRGSMFSTRHLDRDAVASTGTGILQKYVPSAPGMSQGTPVATTFPFEFATQASTSPMTAARSRRLGTDVFPTTTTVVPTRRHLRGVVVNPVQSMCEVEGDGTRCTARCGVCSVDPHPAIPPSTRRLTKANGSRSALRRDLTIRRYTRFCCWEQSSIVNGCGHDPQSARKNVRIAPEPRHLV